ncbi:MAG: alcaligin biosynthesis protein [Kordia sp.]|nr:MAG: alcaligin biosynthesis protein [Kordia sp.]
MSEILDFIGVGVGPFNLSLACLTKPLNELNGIFFDKKEKFNWHPGMLLQDATLQVPFMADLVSLADPTSPLSFLNYLKQNGKIYSFYIRENFYVLRNEYNQYCQWAIKQLDNIQFNIEVLQVYYNADESCYHVTTISAITDEVITYQARKLILGTGTVPYIPDNCKHLKNDITHSSNYINNKKTLQRKESITIVGSGQSAAEIFYDLLQDIDTFDYELNWITRSPRYFPLEYTKLTLEMTSPEYVDYFYNLPQYKRDILIKKQKHLYKGINESLINDIYDLLYTKKITHPDMKVNLRTNSALEKVSVDKATKEFQLTFYQQEQDKYYLKKTNGLILSTGYCYQAPNFIEGIKERIKWDNKGRYNVNRNYTIDHNESEIFIQNAELHTHGFVSPDLGMVCYKNAQIVKYLTGKEYYPIEKNIAFQQFEVCKEEELMEQKQFLELL